MFQKGVKFGFPHQNFSGCKVFNFPNDNYKHTRVKLVVIGGKQWKTRKIWEFFWKSPRPTHETPLTHFAKNTEKTP